MKIPRVRFTVRRMMIAVALVAVLLAATRRVYPIIGFSLGDLAIIRWSDGKATYESGPVPVKYHAVGPIIQVRWSDGSHSWYLTHRFRFRINADHLSDRMLSVVQQTTPTTGNSGTPR